MIGVLFLLAYASSGLAGLVYEVGWTRLLTLELGRSMAASSTVLAVFMGGLAAGAAVAGRLAASMSARRALRVYAALECGVAVLALALPLELHAAAPLFAWAYRDGNGGATFALIRVAVSILLLLLPTLVLGATFPFAVRCFASHRPDASRRVSAIYAANTVGAAIGTALAGFVLLPTLGLTGTLLTGAGFSVLAGVIAGVLSTRLTDADATAPATALASDGPPPTQTRTHRPNKKGDVAPSVAAVTAQPVLAAVLLAVTGAATFSAEVAWTRVIALLVGPSTYAFAAVVTVFVAGTAIGATIAAGLPRRIPAGVAVALCLSAATAAAVWATSLAGTSMPHALVLDVAGASTMSVVVRSLREALVLLPISIALGAAFPFSLRLAGGEEASPRVLGAVYAVNTLAGVVASLGTGFLIVPAIGLEQTMLVSAVLLALGAILAAVTSRTAAWGRVAALVPVVAALVMLAGRDAWDRELLASGAYKYAAAVPPGLDVERALKAGTLVYYRDGAQATVSVKRLTGVLSLAIDGKVDASTGGDMLTQKLLAHVPMLLHGAATRVAIVGLGSGITAASALSHDITELDVLEISPEVVDASKLFAPEGRSPLDDPRTRLLVADGRTHLSLGRRPYDVIIAEPSNPWMAGVAALFTQEYFESAKNRLNAGGVVCQWVNTYDISTADLRSVVATFAHVFPHVTLWMAGEGDLLMVGSPEPLEPRLENVERRWNSGSVATDLQAIRINSPFVLLSMLIGGESAASRFGQDAPLQRDDRMALEFSAPQALHSREQRDNVSALRSLDVPAERPSVVARAWAQATAAHLGQRSQVLRRAGAFEAAYDAAATAVGRDPADPDALQALVDASAPLARQTDALGLLAGAVTRRPDALAPRLALSRLHAATGQVDPAIADVGEWLRVHDDDPQAVEQLASIFSDIGDADRLETAVAILGRHPERASAAYYAAALAFLEHDLATAEASARRALSIEPRYARAMNLLGAILATKGDTEQARRTFNAALELDPQDPTTYQNLATLEMNAGRADVAERLFAEALSIDPTSAVARQGLDKTRQAR